MSGKTLLLKVILFITCAVVLTPGCKKLYDYIGHHGDGDYKVCNIKKIITYNYSLYDTARAHVDTTIYIFTYNQLGDPVSMTHNHITTGNPNFEFHYDKYHRLVEMVQPYGTNSGYELWDRYGYNDKGQIVKDTGYAFGGIVGGVPQPSVNFAYFTYEYDTKGRIIRSIDSIYIGPPGSATFGGAYTHSYVYDANGNLATGQTYDNKLNVNRTNSVWMFLRKDYSANNPFTALQYNDKGLPVSVYGQLKLIPSAGPEIHIEYLCD